MRLAFFSPMPPAKTGVATYSSQLVKALRQHCDLTVFTPTAEALPIDGVRMVNFVRHSGALKSLHAFDQVLYHLGNNPWFHLDIHKVLSLFPAAACLHDTVLYYLSAAMGRGAVLKELLLEDCDAAFGNLRAIVADSAEGDLLRYPTPSKHRCISGILQATPHIIVHNSTSASVIKELGYAGRIDVVPHLHYAGDLRPVSKDVGQALRRQLGYGELDFVFGVFGFIGPTKRLDKVLETLASLGAIKLSRRLRLLIVGEGESLDEPISRFGLEGIVQRTGFVADEDFRRYMGAIDALVNLRYPSHGESSGSLIQAMACGKVCVVTDHGSFSEMPDETVVKVPYDEREVPVLVERMRALVEDAGLLRSVGEAARGYITTMHDPGAVAQMVLSCLTVTQRQFDSRSMRDANFDPTDYIRRRIARAVPEPS